MTRKTPNPTTLDQRRAVSLLCAAALVLQALLPVLHGAAAPPEPSPCALECESSRADPDASARGPGRSRASLSHDCATCPLCQQSAGAAVALRVPAVCPLASAGGERPPASAAPLRGFSLDFSSAPRAPPLAA